ncbi:PML-RARA-regulated adapter molecule 1 isoform X2 [Erinaceus europaeus]|uniref:PML-RARA-regulated adapter molecule 1 isoform X2 n=1 Tax=Erinaceus europaeus TaxID=9365 RepID=A0ABM3WLY1_ERIEU|nr:PML-RARA-regulated adapter molecule 1 isoform X2 [Erinaceus europaeus]
METPQDFRSLQAKFQASQADSSEHPKKPPKPEFNRVLKKFPTPEPASKQPKKPEPPDASMKPSRSEPSDFSKKPPQQPEAGEPARLPPKPPQPELARVPPESKLGSPFPRTPQRPEPTEASPKPPTPGFNIGGFPKKPPVPDFCAAPQKTSQSQARGLPKRSLPSEVPRTPPWKAEPAEPQAHSLKPDLGVIPKKPLQPPEITASPRKPPQLQASGPCKKPPPLQMAPRNSESGEPHHSQPEVSTVPRRPSPGLYPRKPELGDLTRTTSEPDVNVTPKRPLQPEPQAPPKRLPQFNLSGLPRTTSEPEFGVLPRKLSQLGSRGEPRKFSQPEPHAWPRTHPNFSGDLPRKPPLPSSVSESSLPRALLGGPSPGRQRMGGLGHGGARPALQGGPRRRPLPPTSSLGPPPAKPPLPPGLMNIQSFWRPSEITSDILRTESSAGVPRSPDNIYEPYDDVVTSVSPGPNDRDDVSPAKRTLQDPELRKKTPPPQQPTPADPKTQKQLRRAEKAEREFRKKFKFEGEIVIQTRMMIDPNAKTRRGGGKHLGIRRGEILEVIEFTNPEEMLCRDAKGKYGYVPRTALLPLETEVYDDVGFWDAVESQPLSRGR